MLSDYLLKDFNIRLYNNPNWVPDVFSTIIIYVPRPLKYFKQILYYIPFWSFYDIKLHLKLRLFNNSVVRTVKF